MRICYAHADRNDVMVIIKNWTADNELKFSAALAVVCNCRVTANKEVRSNDLHIIACKSALTCCRHRAAINTVAF